MSDRLNRPADAAGPARGTVPSPSAGQVVLAYGIIHVVTLGAAAWNSQALWAWATDGPWLSSAVRLPILAAAAVFAEALGLLVVGPAARVIARVGSHQSIGVEEATTV